MKYIVFILFSYTFSTILHVNGEDYISIQSAIDDAMEDDIILVYPGVYYENLDIDKTITLTSLAYYDDLDSWYYYYLTGIFS